MKSQAQLCSELLLTTDQLEILEAEYKPIDENAEFPTKHGWYFKDGSIGFYEEGSFIVLKERDNAWISVKDKLPIENQRILACNKEEVEMCWFVGPDYRSDYSHAWYIGEESGDCGSLRSPEPYTYKKYIRDVTHWMELPKIAGEK